MGLGVVNMPGQQHVVQRLCGSQTSKRWSSCGSASHAVWWGHYAMARLDDCAALLLVEGNGCDDGFELHHQIWMTLGNVLPCGFIFEKLGEVPFRQHQV